jgi:hypothetical protein
MKNKQSVFEDSFLDLISLAIESIDKDESTKIIESECLELKDIQKMLYILLCEKTEKSGYKSVN